jgi:hypothetical protein
MEPTRELVQGLATKLGVRPDVLEKVVRLLAVLGRLREDEELRDRFALKGGTALNVFWLSLPRLSVDIDLNFIGEISASELTEQRPEFEQRVTRACRLAGCRIAHSPSQHAGGKFRLRFTSVLGGEQNLELDISFVARVPIGELVEREAVLPGFEQERVLTYTLPELAAGKFTALLARVVARDQYDAVRILDHDPAILETLEFRLPFTCFAASAREDARGWSGRLAALDPQDVRTRLVPVLRSAQEPLAGDARKLAAHLEARLEGVTTRLVAWSPAEREFMDALMDHGELKPALLTDRPELRRRIAAQPMLRWKQMNVRQHLGLPPMSDEAD